MDGTTYKNVTHVIFDMDGLLLDTEKAYKAVISEITQGYGKVYTKKTEMKVLGTTEQDSARIVVTECNLPITPEEFREQYVERCSIALQDAKLFPGAEKLIRHLHKHNIPIGLATSSSDGSVKIKTKNHQELFSLFHHKVMGSSDPEVKKGKPSPDIFLVCASRFGVPANPRDCLVFEDAPNGVTAALAAGMQAVMVPSPETDRELTKHATLVLSSLDEFKPESFGLPAFD